jgi:hypothetical protein
MRKGALFVFAVFARFSLDSARTKIPTAKMAASQKISRAALDIFILLVFFYAPALGISLCRNAADTLRLSTRNLRKRLQTTQAESLAKRRIVRPIGNQ